MTSNCSNDSIFSDVSNSVEDKLKRVLSRGVPTPEEITVIFHEPELAIVDSPAENRTTQLTPSSIADAAKLAALKDAYDQPFNVERSVIITHHLE